MDIKSMLEFLSVAEKLKFELRHSWTSSNRQESVAEHSWRLCLFAWLLKSELTDYDIDKVMKMCLFHDLGEAIAGDIPVFEKSSEDEAKEELAVEQIVEMLDDTLKEEMGSLFKEMKAKQTKEAKLFHALDKLEVVLQHNEAPLETWLPLEYELNQTYGTEEVKGIKVLEELREVLRQDTIKKISS